MRLLLDTQCWLWTAGMPEKFSASARRHVRDIRNELYLSSVVAIEIAIKYSVGKLQLPIPPAEFIPVLLGYQRVSLLVIEFSHAIRLASLPFHPRPIRPVVDRTGPSRESARHDRRCKV